MNIKLAHKLALGFGAVMGLSVAMAWFSLSRLDAVNTAVDLIASHDFEAQSLIRIAGTSQDRMKIERERSVGRFALLGSGHVAEPLQPIHQAWRRARAQTSSSLEKLRDAAARYEGVAISTERAVRWREVREAADDALAVLTDVSAAVDEEFEHQLVDDVAEVLGSRSRLNALREDFDAEIERAGALVGELVALGRTASRETYEQARSSILLALLGVLVLGSLASYFIQRGVTGPIREFMRIVDAVGGGDLRVKAPDAGSDEIAMLGRSLNRMVDGLREIATSTREVTESLTSASTEIAASTRQQASSTSEQAASVQETTATMEEIVQSGKQVTDRARQVSELVESSSEAGLSGLRAVGASARSMEGIREQAEVVAENIVVLSEKTQAIGEIIALVTDVAEQSNLIALNAAIEATAAGEQGRRFAVVANEVKSLADQSKGATGQVRGILEDIQKGINTLVMLTEEAVKRVESGRAQTSTAEEVIRQMAEGIDESGSAFGQILGAANQQQIGFEQVSEALKSIRIATEQTASGTSQLERAASSLDALGTQLRQSVERYRV